MSVMPPSHQEISTITTLNVVADYTLFALEIVPRRRARRLNSPISVAERENSIVAISQLMISLEGYINRVLYLLESDDPAYSASLLKREPADRLADILGSSRRAHSVLNKMKELLVTRNSIMHAHLYATERDQNRRILAIEKRILDSGNRSYRNLVDQNTYRTLKYKFHVVPSEIGFDDVFKGLELWNQIYRMIEQKHGRNVAYLPPYYPYGYRRFLSANHRSDEFDAIPLDHDGSFSSLIRYLKNPNLYQQAHSSNQSHNQ